MAILGAPAAAGLPPDIQQRVTRRLGRRNRGARWVARAAEWASWLAAGVRGALHLVRTRDPAVVGAFCSWAFDVGVLWACFEAFGEAPSGGVVVMAYLVGTLANVLPVPGGLGGVEGAMIRAFLAFEVGAGFAVAAVLGYRAFQYWLPIVPGALAYVRLLRTVRSWDDSGEPSR